MANRIPSLCACAKLSQTMRVNIKLLCRTFTAKIRPKCKCMCPIRVAWTSVPCWRNASTPNGATKTKIQTGVISKRLTNHYQHWRKWKRWDKFVFSVLMKYLYMNICVVNQSMTPKNHCYAQLDCVQNSEFMWTREPISEFYECICYIVRKIFIQCLSTRIKIMNQIIIGRWITTSIVSRFDSWLANITSISSYGGGFIMRTEYISEKAKTQMSFTVVLLLLQLHIYSFIYTLWMFLFTICDLLYLFCSIFSVRLNFSLSLKFIHKVTLAQFSPLLCIVFSLFLSSSLEWEFFFFLGGIGWSPYVHFTAENEHFSSANFPRNKF